MRYDLSVHGSESYDQKLKEQPGNIFEKVDEIIDRTMSLKKNLENLPEKQQEFISYWFGLEDNEIKLQKIQLKNFLLQEKEQDKLK